MANRGTGEHWLYDLIDELEINEGNLKARLQSKAFRERLFDSLGKGDKFDPSQVPLTGALVAGIGLDLASWATCTDFKCRNKTSDREFPQVLHYFDWVVMEGPSRSRYRDWVLDTKRRGNPHPLIESIEDDIKVMLHLRKTGLANYIRFTKKVDCYCPEHMKQKADELGLGFLAEDDYLTGIAKEFSRAGRVSVIQTGPRRWRGKVWSSQFSEALTLPYDRKTRPKKVDVARDVLGPHMHETLHNAVTAKELGAPLSSLGDDEFFVPSASAGANAFTVDDVALRVRIPVLLGLNTEQFIKLREEEYDHFISFRKLLRQAIEETVSQAQAESPETAADKVWRNSIQPQVVDLERKISASNRSLVRKLVTGVSFGATSAGVGSLLGAVSASLGTPLGAALGAAAGTVALLPTALPLVTKHFEERQQFETDGAYFVWKAQKAGGHS
ncbi:hypothetical protein [Micromonospora sp. NPDC049107]|uniref:hypothetical protein n=1 Tax=Micromonospora sp. NPDC049107 TaxID=3154349 RepID=UPI0033EE163A